MPAVPFIKELLREARWLPQLPSGKASCIYFWESQLQMKNPIVAIQKLYNETVSELKKCSWPTRRELYDSTIVVVSSLIILPLFVSVVDWLCEVAVRFITGSM